LIGDVATAEDAPSGAASYLTALQSLFNTRKISAIFILEL